MTFVARQLWWRSPRSWAGIALILVASISFLSINVFPVMTNDSVVYLRMSNDLSGYGWVHGGFRQAGYPAVLAVVRSLADLVGADGLLTIALLQRLLLVAAGVLAWLHWRWWSTPLLAFVLAAETMAYPNLVLIEGLALPVAILIVFPTVALVKMLNTEESSRRSAWVYAGAIVVGVLLLVSLRFTYLVFGAIPLFLAWAGWRTPYRKVTTSILVAFGVLAGGFTLVLAVENRSEFGSTLPSVNGEPTEHYYAWLQVFGLRPENAEDPKLAGFYDDGNVYDFGSEINSTNFTRAERAALLEAETKAMLAESGLSSWGSRAESMMWALVGGRLHDITSIVQGVLTSTSENVTTRMYRNNLAADEGISAFADELNDGKEPGSLIMNTTGWSLPLPTARKVVGVILPLSLLWMAYALRWPSLRLLSYVGLAVVIATAIGVGWIRADNFRFMVPSAAFGIAWATAQISTHRADIAESPLSKPT